ncbi:MAG TPA: MMPL family transporter, partial [Halanaerobiales bacterium]|nr:MMPL family transporter [Halanaerobiales bacterium]
SVGSAYAIHIVARYYEGIEEGYEKDRAVKLSIKNVGIAVIMAGGTTMIGFASLFFSDLVIIQDFALGTTIGVGIALLVSIIFIPAVLINLKVTKKSRNGKELKITQNIFKGIESLVFKYRKPLLVFVTIIIVGSIIVIPSIKTESNYITYFKKGSTTRVSTNLVDERFGGSQPVEVVIEGNIKNPELLKSMRDFQEEAVKLSYINNAQSMVNVFREENMALNNIREIPSSQNQIAQYLLLLEMSDKELISNYLTFDYQKNRIQMTMEMVSSTKQKEVLNELEKLTNKYFGEKFKAEITGTPSLSIEINNRIISGQIKSLISAVLFTFVITSLLLKSIKRGFFTTLPIAFTVLVNFGLMGMLNIKLDIATAMIASIAVGIGVDYSIHIFTRFIEENEDLDSSIEALKTSIQTVGRANLYNASAVIVGFIVILLSSFPPLVRFGGLTAFTMVVSFFGALVLLPVLILSAYKISGDKDLLDNN